jgi:hypothetical protein
MDVVELGEGNSMCDSFGEVAIWDSFGDSALMSIISSVRLEFNALTHPLPFNLEICSTFRETEETQIATRMKFPNKLLEVFHFLQNTNRNYEIISKTNEIQCSIED